MGFREPKFVEQYQLSSSNFEGLGNIMFDGYEPTFKTVTLGQEFDTNSNVQFSQLTSSQFLLGSQPISNFFPGNRTTLPVNGDGIINGNLITTGDITIGGMLRAEKFISELTSSTIIFEEGHTKFGDTVDDTHKFSGSFSLSGGTRAVWDNPNNKTFFKLNDFQVNGFASESLASVSSSLKRQDHLTRVGPIIPYAEANITLVQGDISDQDRMVRKNFYKSSTSITANTASFNAVTASNVAGFTNIGKDDFLFFYNGFVIEPNCYDIEQNGATFLLKIDTSKFGFELTTDTAGQTPKVAAWGKFNA
tara:strand:- start:779 stop:1696 length:918 start_codon:yes stop_codon:yes gene_type:complete